MTIYISYPQGCGINHKVVINYENGFPLTCTITYDYGDDAIIYMLADEWARKGSFRSSIKSLKDGSSVLPNIIPYEIKTVIP
jgi:hypothetical protein